MSPRIPFFHEIVVKQLRCALVDAQKTLDLTWSDLANKTDVGQDRLQNFRHEKLKFDLSQKENNKLRFFFRKLIDKNIDFYDKYYYLFSSNTIGDGIYNALNLRISEQKDFSDRCGGNYLVFRTDQRERIVVALLFLKRHPYRPIARYATWRRRPDGSTRVIRGYIFRSGGQVTALGYPWGSKGFLLSKLERLQRGIKTDFLGIQFGPSPEGREECVHIYMSMIANIKNRKDLFSMTGIYDINEIPSRFEFVDDINKVLEYVNKPMLHVGSSF